MFMTNRLLLSVLLLLNGPVSTPQSPSAILIPVAQSIPVLDGSCDDFDRAVAIPWPARSQTATVFVAHNRDTLLVCVQSPAGKLYERWIGVYLDPQADATSKTWAQPNDWSLQINMSLGTLTSQTGDGVGSYSPASAAWQAKRVLADDIESAEFQIPLYGLHLGECGRAFHIALAHQWVNAVAEDYFWPDNASFNQPATWARATLTGTLCPEDLTQRLYVPIFLFNGSVAP